MASLDVHEAETQLSQLLERVLGGEVVVITRDGVPATEPVPARRGGIVLGSGCDDPANDEWWRPMTE